jgi:hypothetical protein
MHAFPKLYKYSVQCTVHTVGTGRLIPCIFHLNAVTLPAKLADPCKFLHIRYIQYIEGEQSQFLSFWISTIIEHTLICFMSLKFPVYSLNQMYAVLSVVKYFTLRVFSDV